MGLAMRTWDVAKRLIEHCDSPEDVGQVITILRDPEAIEEVCSLIAGFSDKEHSSLNSGLSLPTVQVVGGSSSYSGVDKSPSSKARKRSVDSSTLATAKRLQTLFRTKGMTNQQVEQWINSNFKVRANLGKDSLLKYLTKVLNQADLGLSNRLLAAAQRLLSDNSQASSELKDYWDGLDKRFSVSE